MILEFGLLLIRSYQDKFIGVLLTEMKNGKKNPSSLWHKIYLQLFNFIQQHFFKEGVCPYDSANNSMLEELNRKYIIDGEIVFLFAVM